MNRIMSTIPIAPQDGASFSVRATLRTISPPTQKQIRHKSSFILRGDSSEDVPSPHDSIFEAFCFSAANSEDSTHKIEVVPVSQHSPGTADESAGADENSRQPSISADTLSVGNIGFRYGHGTVLETITEQKSSNTMRTLARARSADDVSLVPFLNHCDSFEVARSPRRKQSFSVDDLALIQRNYHEACAMIERETRKPLPVHEIYAQPKDPIHPPVYRPPTPPGVPSWTAAQNLPRQPRSSNNVPGVQNRLQRFLNLPASGITLSSRIPTRSISAPLPSRIAPRFRPPRSAYGSMYQHPFLNAPVAKVVGTPPSTPPAAASSSATQAGTRLPRPTRKRKLGQRVRFTPSATARDSEMVSLQTAILTTSASAVHPLDPMRMTPDIAHGLPPVRCPHRKGRREALKHLNHNISHDRSTPPSNEYLPLSDQSPPRQNSASASQTSISFPSPTNPASLTSSRHTSFTYIDSQPSHTPSLSSTTHLISGVIRSSSPMLNLSNPIGAGSTTSPKEPWCWKCSVEKGTTRIDHWWKQSANCMCIVCFGFEIDDDMHLSHRSGAPRGMHHDMPGGMFGQEIVGPRRVILEQTSAVSF
jgi:hypothetical protein